MDYRYYRRVFIRSHPQIHVINELDTWFRYPEMAYRNAVDMGMYVQNNTPCFAAFDKNDLPFPFDFNQLAYFNFLDHRHAPKPEFDILDAQVGDIVYDIQNDKLAVVAKRVEVDGNPVGGFCLWRGSPDNQHWVCTGIEVMNNYYAGVMRRNPEDGDRWYSTWTSPTLWHKLHASVKSNHLVPNYNKLWQAYTIARNDGFFECYIKSGTQHPKDELASPAGTKTRFVGRLQYVCDRAAEEWLLRPDVRIDIHCEVDSRLRLAGWTWA